MPRSRVLSFMSQFGGPPRSPGPDDEPVKRQRAPSANNQENMQPKQAIDSDPIRAAPTATGFKVDQYANQSSQSPNTTSTARGDSRVTSRPLSMMQTYTPPQVDLAQDTPPELHPIFTFLNSHSNKLYQEGYFLKLHDLDSRGRPSQDRVWNECFAQLVGTVLSLWDAAALDAAGEDGEVMPTFINLSDATIKMIESLPMNGTHGGNLQNVLSISTAANNRYLLHFNSLNSLTQWTAGIRLAMFEHSTLHEAYTGSLIAGKGRFLNNIKLIMERSKFAYEDWARVRFGAGTPWRRCWCVISPPDEKEFQKATKVLRKASSHNRPVIPKGDIKFYDTRKITKKTKPIATISDAYAAYAIYPQSKPLIDQSTLVKLEGLVTTHTTSPETTSEAFIFVMPEAHAAVSGFEMMLRWLFRVFDTFNLYGRPTRLIADTLDQRGLMFALPQDRRYGYLDTLDVSGLIHTSGSQTWSERQWRLEMKKLTAQRMTSRMENSHRHSRQISIRHAPSRASLPPPQRNSIRFDDAAPAHSSPGSRSASPNHGIGADARANPPRRTDSAPPQSFAGSPHKRSASDAQGYRKYMTDTPSRLSHETSRPGDGEGAPTPPAHGGILAAIAGRSKPTYERVGSLDELSYDQAAAHASTAPNLPPPEPVTTPPAFTHSPNSRPPIPLVQAPELRRAHSDVDAATLQQMQDAQRGSDIDGGVSSHPHQQASDTESRDQYTNRQSGLRLDDFDSSQRDPRQRLSTIPGSPFVDAEGEFMDTPHRIAVPQMDAVPEDPALVTHEGASEAERPPMVPLHSSQSIARKPIPKKLPQVPSGEDNTPPDSAQAAQVRVEDFTLPTSPVSPVGSFEGALIDQDALERILNQETDRNDTLLSHVSSVTPDYASTASRSSRGERNETVEKAEKPRAGRLKTVGDPDMPTIDARSGGSGRLDTYHRDLADESSQIPSINFGPTYAYKTTSRPNTSGTMTHSDLRSRSADRLRPRSRDQLTPTGLTSTNSPGESTRHSYFGGRVTPSAVERSDSPSQRNSVAWAPSGQSPGAMHQNRPSLTPEQWVQHRASLAAQPQLAPRTPVPTYAHQRTSSGYSDYQTRQSLSRTPPPFARDPSGDWTQQRQQTPPSRPTSRSAGVYLGHSPGAFTMSSATLSAKEQMHVAHATGSPLITVSSGSRKPHEQPSPGLVGALAAREREKAALQEGVRGSIVQQAILSRQQQQSQLEAEAYAQAQAQFQAQAQYETQQQLAYQQTLMAQQQHQASARHTQPAQLGQMPQARMSWMPDRLSAASPSPSISPMYPPFQTPPAQQYSPQAGGFGGAYFQQQQRPVSTSSSPVPGQQHGQPQNYYAQSAQQGHWQQPR